MDSAANPSVLIIDDNEAVCTALEVLCSLHDITTYSASSPREGLAALSAHPVDLVIQDMNFTGDTTSGEEGVALFHQIREVDADMPIILLTAWTHLETAVSLVKAGAADYMAKPWDDDKLMVTAQNLIELRAASRSQAQFAARRLASRQRLAGQYDLQGLIYESDAMHELLSVALRVAHADVPVLITGANGAGKEKLAEIIQANSACPNGPFVKVNAGALPAELIESELFGAQAGAFTGARQTRQGRFEAADGGTLFLDEIGNLPSEGQAKLLRVLQTGEFERLGSSQTVRVNVRVISATNSDLPAAIERGEFREDLFYRLNLIELQVPPLADRIEDVLPLAEHFVDDQHFLSPAARSALLGHDWPGNVRELANCIQRACLLASQSQLEPPELGLPASTGPRYPANHGAANDLDAQTVKVALERNGGVVAHAARELGLSRQALYRRMDKFGLPRSQGGQEGG